MKSRIVFYLFVVILAQTLLAVTAGFFVFCLADGGRVAPGVFAGDMYIGEISRQEALSKLERASGRLETDQEIQLMAEDGQVFTIPLRDLEPSIHYRKAMLFIKNNSLGSMLANLTATWLGAEKVVIPPEVELSGGKLLQWLDSIAPHVFIAPVDADLSILDGRIVKTKEEKGWRLDVNQTVRRINEELQKGITEAVYISVANDGCMIPIEPEMTLKDLEGMDAVLSTYSTRISPISDTVLLDAIAAALNKQMILPGGQARMPYGNKFSFHECLAENGLSQDTAKEEFSQAASTLYAAVLLAGLDKAGISRAPNKTQPEYIDPGLDADVSEKTRDFSFVNSTKHPLTIHAEIDDGVFRVTLAGNREDMKADFLLRTELVQKFISPVIHVESADLKSGEKDIVDPGKDGIKVNIYRRKMEAGNIIGEELIGTDTYEAVTRIIRIGPGTGWTDLPDK